MYNRVSPPFHKLKITLALFSHSHSIIFCVACSYVIILVLCVFPLDYLFLRVCTNVYVNTFVCVWVVLTRDLCPLTSIILFHLLFPQNVKGNY